VYEGERGEGDFGEFALKAIRSKGEAGSGTGSSSAAKWIEMEGTGDGGTMASMSVGLVWRKKACLRGRRKGTNVGLGDKTRQQQLVVEGKSDQHLAEGRRSRGSR
jgi:hypothetical protein